MRQLTLIARSAPLAAALLWCPATAPAQLATGTITAEATSAPVRGAVVTLLTVGGAPTDRRGLTDERGAFSLRAPSAGTFIVEVRAIGFTPRRSAPVALGAGETRTVDLTLRHAATRLSGLRVEARSACRRAEQLEGVATEVWDDVWAALASTAISYDQHILRTDVFLYARELDPATGLVQQENRRTVSVVDERPFQTAPARDLAQYGFWRATVGGEINFYAPDAHTLISAEFLSSHCFTLVRSEASDVVRIGLSFRPVRDQPRDVEGVLWIDPDTRELRSLEYSYTGLPSMKGLRAEGRMAFWRLPNGAWVDDHWLIRQPYERPAGGASPPAGQPRGTELMLREGGGFVLTDSARNHRFVGVIGAVRGDPRPDTGEDIIVEVLGTELVHLTNDAGEFVFDDILPGTYLLRIHRNGAGEQGGFVQHGALSLAGGEIGRVEVPVPSPADVAERLCGERRTPGTMPAFVILRNADTRRAAAGYSIELTWAQFNPADPASVALRRSDVRRLTADWRGEALACDVPAGAQVRFRNVGAGLTDWSDPVPLGRQLFVAEILVDTATADSIREATEARVRDSVARTRTGSDSTRVAPRPAVGPRLAPQPVRRPPVRPPDRS
jgi:hypothetical protein